MTRPIRMGLDRLESSTSALTVGLPKTNRNQPLSDTKCQVRFRSFWKRTVVNSRIRYRSIVTYRTLPYRIRLPNGWYRRGGHALRALNRSQGEMCTREGLAMGLEVLQQLFSPRLQAVPLLRTRNHMLDNTPADRYILYIYLRQ